MRPPQPVMLSVEPTISRTHRQETLRSTLRLTLLPLVILLSACGSSAPAGTPSASGSAGAAAASAKPAAGSPAAGSPSPKASLENITVSIPAQSLSQFPLTVGKNAGIYQKHGINLTIETMRSDAAIAAAISGDAAYSTPAGSLIRAIGQGAPLKLVATVMDKSNHLMIINPKAIPTPKDLAGKRVAVNGLADNTQLEAEAVYTHFGVDKKTAQFVVIPDDGPKVAALQAGSVDAAMTTIPWNFKAEELGMKTLVNMVDILALPTSILATSNQNIASHSASVQNMVDATLEATRYTRDQKDNTVKEIAKFYSIPDDQASQAFDLSKDAWSATGILSQDAFDNAAAPLSLNPPLTIDKVWDPQFVQKSSAK
ncbi:MAG TPA: ABC transporter substrate-binding protein [Chloroflexota bacterium]|nr:ABC transporter substrate-binding protein [Chloroflexota bacterium]